MSDFGSRFATNLYDTEDEEQTVTSPSFGSRFSQSLYSLQPQQAQPQWTENRAVQTGLGAARGLASLFEPLALPQDVAFAIAAGNADPDDDVSIADKLKNIEWAKYAPLGASPARPADGREILERMGIDDEATRKWGGLALDLVADPLVAGSAIRAAGKLGRVEKLVALGDKVDELTSIGGLARTAYRSSPALKAWTDNRTTALLKAMRNPANVVANRALEGAAYVGLTTRTARNLKYGREAGEAISDIRALSTQAGDDVLERGMGYLDDIDAGVMGRDGKDFLQKGWGILSGRRRAETELKGLPQILRDVMDKEAYDLANKRGVLTTDLTESAIPEVQSLSSFSRYVPESRRAQAVSDTEAAAERVREAARSAGFSEAAAETRFRTFAQKVSEVDAMFGFHVTGLDWVQKKVMENVRLVGGSDADAAQTWERLVAAGMQGNYDGFLKSSSGIKLSGVGAGEAAANAERRSVYSQVMDEQLYLGSSPAEARRLAAEARDSAAPAARSATRESVTELYQRRLESLQGGVNRGSEDAFKATRQDSLASSRLNSPLTYNEVLFRNKEDAFSALDLGAYFRGLQEGHLRRSYAAFSDPKGADAWVRSLEQGRVVMSNILSDDMVDRAFEGVGNAGELVKTYRTALEREGRGTVLSQRALMQHLTENGVSRKDAQNAYMKLVGEMNPEMQGVLSQIKDYAEGITEAATNKRGGGQGRAFFGEREELDAPFLEMLGEYANPLFSLAESAQAAKTRTTRGQFMRELYELGKEKGLVRDARHVDDNGAAYRLVDGGEGAWGAFSGTYVNPFLKDEMLRTMKQHGDPNAFMQGVARIRSMITGGYLASPNVIVANLAGGVYSSAMTGISPTRYVRALAASLPELYHGKSKDFDRMREFISVDAGGITGTEFGRELSRHKLDASGLHQSKPEEVFSRIGDFISGQIRSPFGLKWAGLEGFAFAEKWMRTAAFKAERDYWGANLSRLEKYVPGVSRMGADDAAAAVDKFAAQKARIALLDYSELPPAISALRNTGLLPFAAFPFLISARNVNAAINRPGRLAMADRVSEAIWNAYGDNEEQLAVYAGLPDWLKEEQGVPVRVITDAAGDKRVSVIPFSGLLPTHTTFGAPYAESISNVGLYGPLIDLVAAFTRGDGVAPLSENYGKRVFSPDARGMDKLTQAGSFLVQSIAPAYTRKLYSGTQAAINWARSGVPMDGELAKSIYSFQERETKKADRRLADQVLSTFLRSPQVVTMSGPLANVRKEADRLRIRKNTELSAIKQRFSRAQAAGNTRKAEAIRQEYLERAQEFAELQDALATLYGGGAERTASR